MRRFLSYVTSIAIGTFVFWLLFPDQPWQMFFGAVIAGLIYWSVDEIM